MNNTVNNLLPKVALSTVIRTNLILCLDNIEVAAYVSCLLDYRSSGFQHKANEDEYADKFYKDSKGTVWVSEVRLIDLFTVNIWNRVKYSLLSLPFIAVNSEGYKSYKVPYYSVNHTKLVEFVTKNIE